MTTKQDKQAAGKKVPAGKTKVEKAQVSKKQASKTQVKSESIGFLRAAEKMHMSVLEIPLTFFEDLGFSKDRIRSLKNANRKFVSGMYGRVDGMTTKMGSIATAPARAFDAILGKLKPAAKEASTKKGAVKAKPVARKAAPKAAATRAKPKAAAARAKSKAAPKARSRAKPLAVTAKAATQPNGEAIVLRSPGSGRTKGIAA